MTISNPGVQALTLRQLQYVVAVADALSFRKAAERCHVSQPALSVQIRQLEGLIGARLLERHSRHVALTDAGRVLNEAARRLLRDVDAAVEVLGTASAAASRPSRRGGWRFFHRRAA